jgi:hypothetical protein
MRPSLALVAALLPSTAHAQLEVARSPAPASALAPVANPRAQRTPPRQHLFSLRFALGASVALGRNAGSAFAYGLSAGSRSLFPFGGERAWVLGADAGIDRTTGFDEREATHLSLGGIVGASLGTWGVAWAPRAVLAATDAGGFAWGVRNGARLLLIAGVIDLEVAHQYLGGPSVVNHQLLVTIGLDPGMVIHALSQHRGRW